MEEYAYKGGAGNFANNPDRAREAGKAGGKVSGGNFRNDPARAVEAGRKGGKISRRPAAKNDKIVPCPVCQGLALSC